MVISYGLTVKLGEKVFPLAVAVSISFICFTVFGDRKYISAVIISISIKTVKIFGENCAPYLCIVLIGLQTAENLPPDSALKERCSIEKRMAELKSVVHKQLQTLILNVYILQIICYEPVSIAVVIPQMQNLSETFLKPFRLGYPIFFKAASAILRKRISRLFVKRSKYGRSSIRL